MGFLDKLGKAFEIGETLLGMAMEAGAKEQGRMYREAERRYKRQTGNSMSHNNSNNRDERQQVKNPFLIGDKTLEQWDHRWQSLGILSDINLSPYNHYVGVYRAILAGRIIYIGRAIEWNNGGFRKRLSDYRRESNSARHHGSGQKMYLHRDQLHIDIIVTGSDEQSAKVATQLEVRLIAKYVPEWNVKINNK
ncbi:hypothetical protein [Clostridium tyrobutyricum]|uniref:hypothetical protein n=1 Tax=Clostridium tyrobutyricum TaxID=1519 RepID=UPI0011CBA807|nr:hypothetical protein [Clostridium tyrobutyricum]